MQIEQIEVSPGGDRPIVSVRYVGRNNASDAVIEGRFFQVGRFREGKLRRAKEFSDEAEARAAFDGA
jgi:hypothetical protein